MYALEAAHVDGSASYRFCLWHPCPPPSINTHSFVYKMDAKAKSSAQSFTCFSFYLVYTCVCVVVGRVDIPGQVICVLIQPTAKHDRRYKEYEVYLFYV
jgi:hypothetical protein